jgi:enoyl-CoA hydratase/carnithine racemase
MAGSAGHLRSGAVKHVAEAMATGAGRLASVDDVAMMAGWKETVMEALRLDRIGSVAVITLDRPDKLNAITTVMLDELDAALTEVETSDARAVIVTGAGRGFCAGSDISGQDQHHGDTRSFAENRIRRMHALILRLVEYRQPSIAALNGLAYGGGLEIALACTFRTAALTAKLCMPEIRHSLVPSYGGTQLLPRLIGAGRALEMMLTGESVDADEALRIGLVNAVDADPVAAAIALAERMPNGAGAAQRMIRRAVAIGGDLPLSDALDCERKLAMDIAVSDEARQGAASFTNRNRQQRD